MSDFTTHRELPDGGTIRTAVDGAYDWTDPNGKHHRGKATNEATAMEAAEKLYQAWIVERWATGQGVGDNTYKVKLK